VKESHMAQNNGPKPRQTILEPDPQTELVDREEAQQTFLEFEAIQAHLGGVVQIIPERLELYPDTGVYGNRRLVFRWHSYVPATRAEHNGQPAEVREEEPDPVEAS